MNERIFPAVPNIAFFKIVRQYSFWLGKRHLTMDDAFVNLQNYVHYASRNN